MTEVRTTGFRVKHGMVYEAAGMSEREDRDDSIRLFTGEDDCGTING